MALAVVLIDIDAGEIADDDQVEVAVFVEIDQRTAVGAAVAFVGDAGVLGDVDEVAAALVLQDIAGVTVVGVVVGRGELPAGVGRFVLGDEQIEVAVAVDVAGGEAGRGGEGDVAVDHAARRLVELAGAVAFIEEHGESRGRTSADDVGADDQVIDYAVAAEVGEQALQDDADDGSAHLLSVEYGIALVPEYVVGARRDQFGQTVAVEVLGDQVVVAGAILEPVQRSAFEHGRAVSSLHGQPGGGDLVGDPQAIVGLPGGPVHRDGAGDVQALRLLGVFKIDHDIERRAPTPVGVLIERRVMPFGLDDAIPLRSQRVQHCIERIARDGAHVGVESRGEHAFDALFPETRISDLDLVVEKGLCHGERVVGGALLVPQFHERLLVLLREHFLRPDLLILTLARQQQPLESLSDVLARLRQCRHRDNQKDHNRKGACHAILRRDIDGRVAIIHAARLASWQRSQRPGRH